MGQRETITYALVPKEGEQEAGSGDPEVDQTFCHGDRRIPRRDEIHL
jgi:hypothetical protein